MIKPGSKETGLEPISSNTASRSDTVTAVLIGTLEVRAKAATIIKLLDGACNTFMEPLSPVTTQYLGCFYPFFTK